LLVILGLFIIKSYGYKSRKFKDVFRFNGCGWNINWQTLGNTLPTSNVFSVGATSANNGAYNYVAYCFADVEGYSKFGSYTGNGSADGPFVYLGFRPKLLIVKAVDNGGGWLINDSERSPYNITGLTLYADSTASAESYTIGASEWDFLSNGFKNRDAGSAQNTSGNRYIYMAFAENPFKNSLAR
jgi:hypothetical protein